MTDKRKKAFKEGLARLGKNSFAVSVLSLICFIIVWEVVASLIGMEIILPTPIESLKSIAVLFPTGAFWVSVGNTLLKTLLSFSVSALCAIVFSVLGGRFPIVHRLLSPIVTIFRAVPTMSVILLALIWFNSKIAPTFVAFLIIFPTLYSSFYSAVTGVDKKLVEMAKSFKADNFTIVFRLYLPQVAPSFFDAIKNGISLNVKLIIAAEVLAQTRNTMGVNMQVAQIYLDTSLLMGWTIVAVGLSYLLELCVALIKKAVVRWN